MPRVTIVIPNWNGLEHLEDCFRALGDQVFRDFEVVFVDNFSADDSLDWIRQHAPNHRDRTRGQRWICHGGERRHIGQSV